MSISRLFYSPSDADRAVSELTEAGFDPAMIHAFTPSIPPVTARMLEAMGIAPGRAKVFADDIGNGATLLLVEAPLGSAAIATEILESVSPGNSGETQVHVEAKLWDDTTPISSAFNWPTISKDPTPMSNFFGWPLLSKLGPKERWFGLPLLLKSHAIPLFMGMPLILKDGKTLSAVFGWPTLSKSNR